MIARSGPAALAVLALLAIASATASAGEIVLRNTWIQKYMNKVNISSPCMVDTTHKAPNAAADDGDLHMACRCDEVDLPMVAEIVNAADFPSVVTAAKQAKRSRTQVQVTGAWRIWIEHPSAKAQRQGTHVPVLKKTNPDHMFEIHPLTLFDGDSLQAGFKVIAGYTTKPVATTFKHYESRVFTVERKGAFTSIASPKSVYNYAKFKFKVAGTPNQLSDGWAAQVKVEGVVTDSTRRVVAPNRTGPATLLSKAVAGGRYEAIGIPRIDLRRIEQAAKSHPNQEINVPGAYEMILVSLKKL
jgi:hypothetical protein